MLYFYVLGFEYFITDYSNRAIESTVKLSVRTITIGLEAEFERLLFGYFGIHSNFDSPWKNDFPCSRE